MSQPRSDVSRLFQHFGLDPSDYLPFASAQTEAGLSQPGGASASDLRSPRIADPAARAAHLRAKLLGADTH